MRPPTPPNPPSPLPRRPLLLAGLCGLVGMGGTLPGPAAAQPPTPLCGDGAPPPYPAPDQPPLVHSWLLDGRRDGPAPDCTGLRTRDVELLVRLAGSYRAPGELDDQLARVGAVSTQTGLNYWSFTDRRRLVLVRESAAVDSLAQPQRRADFSAAELRGGAECVFVQTDNRSGKPAPYGMTLVQAAPKSFSVRVENLADIRMMGLLLLAPREMQWIASIERLGPGLWGYRSLMALRRLRLGRDEQHRLSNLSRCVAVFDHLAGRQTEVEHYR